MSAYTAIERRREVQSRYKRRYNLLQYRGIPTNPVLSGPVLDHTQALFDLGWSSESVAHMTGQVITHAAITRLHRDRHATVQRRTAAAILALPLTLAVPARIPDTCMVPALGAERRVKALMRLGWNHDLMRNRYGFDTTSLARGRTKQMVARRWRAVAAMYDELCMTPGPSPKTTTYARNNLFQPPLAWWNIDDPDEAPQLGRGQHPGSVVDREVVARLLDGHRIPSTKAEKEEAMRRWLADGRSARSLCVIHGWGEGRYVNSEELTA